MKDFFDRVVLINLKRRPDRLARVLDAMRRCRWPFRWPEIFSAVDGHVTPPPSHWQHGPSAWGCLMSHATILRETARARLRSVLILEDDLCFAPRFEARVARFLRDVPENWDQLMLGGQHFNFHGEPAPVSSRVVRCTDCERTHCYGIRGQFMRRLSERLLGGGRFAGNAHCDWIMGRDPDMQLAHKVYAPVSFLVGQERGFSDILGCAVPRRFWNPPGPDLWVVNLHAPLAVVAALQSHGLATGRGLGKGRDLDAQLAGIFSRPRREPDRRQRLHDWIKQMQWELAGDPTMVCTIAHPDATKALVRAASLWPVCDVHARSMAEALRQLRRHRLPQASTGRQCP